MYIHVVIYTHIYTHIHIYIHVHIYLYIHIYTHIYIYIHICIHAYIRTYLHTYIHTFIIIHTYIHTFIHTYIRTYTHTHTHIYTHDYKWKTCTVVIQDGMGRLESDYYWTKETQFYIIHLWAPQFWIHTCTRTHIYIYICVYTETLPCISCLERIIEKQQALGSRMSCSLNDKRGFSRLIHIIGCQTEWDGHFRKASTRNVSVRMLRVAHHSWNFTKGASNCMFVRQISSSFLH
jgi:hypothetical protein